MQAVKGASFEESLQVVQSKAQQQVALLGDEINAAILDEHAARQKRHTFTVEAVSDMSKPTLWTDSPPATMPIGLGTKRNYEQIQQTAKEVYW